MSIKQIFGRFDGRSAQILKDEDGRPRTKADGGQEADHGRSFSPIAVRLKDENGQRTSFNP